MRQFKVKSKMFKEGGFTPTPVFAKLFRCSETARSAHQQNRCRGFTLLYSVLISSLLLSLGLAIFNIIIKELIISSTIRDSQIAFSAADAGAECALYWDLKHPGLDNGAFGGPSLGELNQGLVGHWTFDEGTGTTAEDSSGNGNTGTINGATWTSSEVSGGALSFDGLDDYVVVDDSGAMAGTNAITLVAWIRRNATGEIMFAVNKHSTHYRLAVRQNGTPYVRFVGENEGAIELNATTNIDGGGWYHVSGIWDGGTMKIYVNGVLENTTTSSDTDIRTNAGEVELGGYVWGACPPSCAGFLEGALDDVRIYNRVLDDGEINDLYTLTATETFDQPVAEGSNIMCNGEDISSSWDASETDTGAEPPYAKTVFDMNFPNETCATVTVTKEGSTTKIDSRGYNTCDLNYPRRVERGLRVTY